MRLGRLLPTCRFDDNDEGLLIEYYILFLEEFGMETNLLLMC